MKKQESPGFSRGEQVNVVPVGKLWTEGPKPVDQCGAFLWILRYAFALVGSELQQRHSGCFSGTIGAQMKTTPRGALRQGTRNEGSNREWRSRL